MEIMKLMTLL